MPSGLTMFVSEMVQLLPQGELQNRAFSRCYPHSMICQDSGYIKIYAIRSKKLTRPQKLFALSSAGSILPKPGKKSSGFSEGGGMEGHAAGEPRHLGKLAHLMQESFLRPELLCAWLYQAWTMVLFAEALLLVG